MTDPITTFTVKPKTSVEQEKMRSRQVDYKGKDQIRDVREREEEEKPRRCKYHLEVHVP